MKPSIFLNELIDLKHMETLEKMPFEAQHKIFKRLAEIADSKTLTKEEQEKYDNIRTNKNIVRSSIHKITPKSFTN